MLPLRGSGFGNSGFARVVQVRCLRVLGYLSLRLRFETGVTRSV